MKLHAKLMDCGEQAQIDGNFSIGKAIEWNSRERFSADVERPTDFFPPNTTKQWTAFSFDCLQQTVSGLPASLIVFAGEDKRPHGI